MKSRNKVLLAGIGTATLLSGGMLAQSAFAKDSSSQSTLVSALASKFNLKQSDVQAVLDQQAQTREASQQAKEKTRLDQAVKDGTLTQAKEDLIIAKQAEIKQRMNSLSSMAASDRKTALQQLQKDTKTWAQQNGIDLKWVQPFGQRRGPGMKRSATAATPAS
jgi:flagellum-specific peptidoglycan hydrolase FlgJ